LENTLENTPLDLFFFYDHDNIKSRSDISGGGFPHRHDKKYPQKRPAVVLYLTTKNWVKTALDLLNLVKPYRLV